VKLLISELDGEQMRSPEEGEAAQVVQEKCGGEHAEEESLIVGMDQKAKEHA